MIRVPSGIGIMPTMSREPALSTNGLLPLPRPLMTAEVLDAAFRLFRAGLLRCLPYSGLAVLVLELPTLISTFGEDGFLIPVIASPFGGGSTGTLGISESQVVMLVSMLLDVALFGMITLRLYTLSQGERPSFRAEVRTAVRRWPAAVIATIGALGFPLLLFGLGPMFTSILPGEALFVVAVPLVWPTALFIVALPAFWCDRFGPFAAIAWAVRISRRRSWRMVGAIMATTCIVLVFYALFGVLSAMLTPILGRADLFLIATVRSVFTLVVGALGVPFVLAMLIVAYQDLRLREQERRAVLS
jgi:hypothetical protein